MAKDPAMLWYWSDWHSGTITLSRFLKGCYMDVLHAQFNSGRLTLEEIKTVLGSDFGQAWPAIQKKFAVDDTGKYFNERLELEKAKRANFTESRRKNLESHKDTHMHQHTASRMENVNRNGNDIVIGIEGGPGETMPPRPKPAEDDLYEPLSELWFNHIFDDMELERKAMAYRDHDITDQFKKFKSKVIGSPAEYIYRDTAGMRNAFDYQLRNSKPDKQKNNIPRGTLEEFRKL